MKPPPRPGRWPNRRDLRQTTASERDGSRAPTRPTPYLTWRDTMSSQPISVGTTQAPREKPISDPGEARQGPNVTASDAIRSVSDQDLAWLQGTWRSISMVMEGRRIPPAALEHRRIIVIDDKYVVVDGE